MTVSKMTNPLWVILFHGYGQDQDSLDFSALRSLVRTHTEHVICPSATFSALTGGKCWFEIPENILFSGSVTTMRPFESSLQGLLSSYRTILSERMADGLRAQDAVAIGFSQGATVAAYLACHMDVSFKGLALMHGLPPADVLLSNRRFPERVLALYDDFSITRDLRLWTHFATLAKDSGSNVESIVRSNTRHAIVDEDLEHIDRFLTMCKST
jgi:predicted esterase